MKEDGNIAIGWYRNSKIKTSKME